MNGVGKVNLFFRIWIQCLKSMNSLKTFSPFLLYALFQGAVLTALIFFAYPPFSAVLVPIMRKLFGEPALHYPNNFLVLSPLFNQANILLSGFIGIIIIGIATHMFATLFRDLKPSFAQGIKVTLPKYGMLFVVWLVETVLILAAVVGLPLLLNKLAHPGGQSLRLIEFASLLLGILIGAIFAYTTAIIVLDRQGITKAISGSFSIFSENAVFSFFLIGVPAFFHLPVEFLTRRANLLVSKFAPEIMIAVLIIGIVISVIANYLLVGTVTRFYLVVTEK